MNPPFVTTEEQKAIVVPASVPGLRLHPVPAGSFLMGACNLLPDALGGLRRGLVGKRFGSSELGFYNGSFYLESCDVSWNGNLGPAWSFRVAGRLRMPCDGLLRLFATAKNGLRLRLAGQLLLDAWEDGQGQASIVAAAEQEPAIIVEGHGDGAGGSLRLEWEWEGHQREVIPAEALLPPDWCEGAASLEHLGGVYFMPYGNYTERPAHAVEITRDFHMSEEPVTAEQFRRFRPDYVGEGYATGVSWHEARAFCEWLSEREGACYRLPTEAEWEYACRAGSGDFFSSGSMPPDEDEANAFGLRRMHATPPEWVADWLGAYPASEQRDPAGPAGGYAKVVRGGPVHDGKPDVPAVDQALIPGIDFDAPFFYRSANRCAIEPDFPPVKSGRETLDRVLVGGLFRGQAFEEYQRPVYFAGFDCDLGGPIPGDYSGQSGDYFGGLGRHWSARVTGTLRAPESGLFAFRVEANAGARLFVDGNMVVDAWQSGEGAGEFRLDAGGSHEIAVEMRNGDGAGGLKVYWSRDGEAEEIISRECLEPRAVPAWYVHSPVGFRVVRGDLPEGEGRPFQPPFAFEAVRQDERVAEYGPSMERPWFAARPVLPVPPENKALDVIEAAGYEGLGCHHQAPGVCVCPNGDVLLLYYSALTKPAEFYPNVEFIVTRLRAGSESFDRPELFPLQAGLVGGSSLLWRDGRRVWMFQGAVGCGRAPFRFSWSDDNGATWAPFRFPSLRGVIDTFTPQTVTSAFRDAKGRIYVANDGHGPCSLLWASDDEGESWVDTGGRVPARHAPFIPMPDGSIFSAGGKHGDIEGFMPFSRSRDGGRTWETWKSPFARTGGNQRPTLLRLASGRLFFATDNYRNFQAAQPEGFEYKGAFVALSEDEGESWRVKRLDAALLHEHFSQDREHQEFPVAADWPAHPTIGYCVATQAPNGVIHLISSMCHPNMHFEMNEAWILSEEDGRDMRQWESSGAALRIEEKDGESRARLVEEAVIGADGRYLLHGERRAFHPDGSPLHEARYELGRLVGMERHFTARGGTDWECEHGADGLTRWTRWWDNGQKRHESFWKGHLCHGPARCWSPDGRLIREQNFEDGNPRS